MDVTRLPDQWIVRDYLPELLEHHAARFPGIDELCALLPRATVATLPVPRDCRDGFMAAFWARPWAHLDPAVRGDLHLA